MTDLKLQWVAFWCFMAVLAVGVTSCESRALVAMLQPGNDYQECIDRCPMDWNSNFEGLECPRMCEQLQATGNEPVAFSPTDTDTGTDTRARNERK